jgi:hypothetical protein
MLPLGIEPRTQGLQHTPRSTIELRKRKKSFVFKEYFIRPIGFEPMTYGLEGRCSIQLSYERLCFYI